MAKRSTDGVDKDCWTKTVILLICHHGCPGILDGLKNVLSFGGSNMIRFFQQAGDDQAEDEVEKCVDEDEKDRET